MKDSIGQKDGMGWGKGNLARPWEAKQRKDLQFPAHEKLPLPGQGGLRAKCTESRGTSRGQSKWRQQVETVPKYFILSVAMVNGIVSLISLSIFSLLVTPLSMGFSRQEYWSG